jgi:hypothetical protein
MTTIFELNEIYESGGQLFIIIKKTKCFITFREVFDNENIGGEIKKKLNERYGEEYFKYDNMEISSSYKYGEEEEEEKEEKEEKEEEEENIIEFKSINDFKELNEVGNSLIFESKYWDCKNYIDTKKLRKDFKKILYKKRIKHILVSSNPSINSKQNKEIKYTQPVFCSEREGSEYLHYWNTHITHYPYGKVIILTNK